MFGKQRLSCCAGKVPEVKRNLCEELSSQYKQAVEEKVKSFPEWDVIAFNSIMFMPKVAHLGVACP